MNPEKNENTNSAPSPPKTSSTDNIHDVEVKKPVVIPKSAKILSDKMKGEAKAKCTQKDNKSCNDIKNLIGSPLNDSEKPSNLKEGANQQKKKTATQKETKN